MPIAAFGKKVFQVSSNKVYTFDGFSLSGDYETENQEVKEKKPSTLKKGPGLETISFSVALDSTLGVNVLNEINAWRNLRDAGVPYVFSIGGKPISKYKWLLKSVGVNDPLIDNKGRMRKASIDLTFKEHVRPGTVPKKTTKKKAPAKKSKSKKKTTSKSSTRIDIDSLVGNKRKNPNASKSINKGTKKR